MGDGDAGRVDDDALCRQRLYEAARDGNTEEVRAALAEGAPVDSQDPWGLTALHSAALCSQPEVGALLLEYGATVDLISAAGKTALHMAASASCEKMVKLLLDSGADVNIPTAYGSHALDMARQVQPRGPCEMLILENIEARLREADSLTLQLRARLEQNDRVKEQLRRQLGKGDGDAFELPWRTHAEDAARRGGPAPGGPETAALQPCGYWTFAAQRMAVMRQQGEDAMGWAGFRSPPPGGMDMDPFAWDGSLTAKSPLPSLDPGDQEMLEDFRRMALAVDDIANRSGRTCAETDMEMNTQANEELVARTGKNMVEWEALVLSLRAPDAVWNWSKLEVRRSSRGGSIAGVTAAPGVFAVRSADDDYAGEPGSVIFSRHQVIGPIGGVYRRKSTYQAEWYGGRKMVFHDPCVLVLQKRSKSSELRLEELLVDLTLGSTNRLKYLAEARTDPMGLEALLEGPGPDGVFAARDVAFPLRKYGESFPRVRSRPSSPNHGDGGAEEAAAVEEVVNEARGAAAERAAQEAAEEAKQRAGIAAAANVIVVEVMVEGWPYAFAVASRDICEDEQLLVDLGEEHWANQRATLARLNAMGKIGHDLVVGVDVALQDAAAKEASKLAFRERPPMRRPILN